MFFVLILHKKNIIIGIQALYALLIHSNEMAVWSLCKPLQQDDLDFTLCPNSMTIFWYDKNYLKRICFIGDMKQSWNTLQTNLKLRWYNRDVQYFR